MRKIRRHLPIKSGIAPALIRPADIVLDEGIADIRLT
jgi:hypothetical protein